MKQTKLRVWWMPILPSRYVFYVSVKNIKEAILTYNALADYDLFLNKHGMKEDRSNSGSLQCFNENTLQWEEWEDKHTGMDFCELLEQVMRVRKRRKNI